MSFQRNSSRLIWYDEKRWDLLAVLPPDTRGQWTFGVTPGKLCVSSLHSSLTSFPQPRVTDVTLTRTMFSSASAWQLGNSGDEALHEWTYASEICVLHSLFISLSERQMCLYANTPPPPPPVPPVSKRGCGFFFNAECEVQLALM